MEATSDASWPVAGGDMGNRIRGHDWSRTPLGPVASWPEILRTVVQTALESAFPTFVWWGPERIGLYNDAAVAILRAKHPEALGKPAHVAWADVWSSVGPLFDQVSRTGQPYVAEDMELLPERGGPIEPAYFTFTYSVLRDVGGEVAGLQAVAIETTAAIRDRAALRESETTYRTLFESLDEGFGIIERIDVAPGEPIDFRCVVANPAFASVSGDDDVVGRTMREVLPGESEDWFETYDAVLRSGEPVRFERDLITLGRTLNVYAVPVDDGKRRRLAVINRDVTERKRAEANLAFLAEVSQELVGLTDIARTMDMLGCRLAAFLGLSACAFAELQDSAQIGVIDYGWHQADTPSLLGTYRMEEFVSPEVLRRCRAGEAVVIHDVFADPLTDGEQYAALNIGSFVSIPLVRDGEWRFLLVVYRSKSSRWRNDEIDLMRELTTRIWTRLERARAEEALARSEEKYRTLFDSIDQGFCTLEIIVDDGGQPVDYRFLDINPAFETSTGLTGAVGRRMRDLVPGHEPFWFAVYGRIAQTGVAERFEHEAAALGRWYSVFGYRIGEPEQRRVAVLFEDITERKRAEAAVRASEGRFQAITNIVPDLLWSNDALGNITWCNQRLLQYTGREVEALMGHGWLTLLHPEDAARNRRDFVETLHTGGAFSWEHRLRRHDGAYRWFLVRAEPGSDPAGAMRWFGAATDIHDARKARNDLEFRVGNTTAELRALSRRLLEVQEEERRHMARELHDEIGQALTGLQLRLASARRGGVSSIAEAEAIVRELTGRVSALSLDLRPAALDTLGLLPALLSYVERYEARTGIEVDLRHQGVGGRFPPNVEIAAYRVVQEALTNVARHARSENATVHLLADAAMMTIVVRDRGDGFDPAAIASAGGLSGLRERIELLGGVVGFESTPGAGMAVTAELPIDGLTAANRQERG